MLVPLLSFVVIFLKYTYIYGTEKYIKSKRTERRALSMNNIEHAFFFVKRKYQHKYKVFLNRFSPVLSRFKESVALCLDPSFSPSVRSYICSISLLSILQWSKKSRQDRERETETVDLSTLDRRHGKHVVSIRFSFFERERKRDVPIVLLQRVGKMQLKIAGQSVPLQIKCAKLKCFVIASFTIQPTKTLGYGIFDKYIFRPKINVCHKSTIPLRHVHQYSYDRIRLKGLKRFSPSFKRRCNIN